MQNSPNINCQRKAVMNHLVQYGSIEHKEAREQYGCEALRSRISELRKAGIPVGDQIVKFTSRFGHKGWCKRYVLSGDPHPLDGVVDLEIVDNRDDWYQDKGPQGYEGIGDDEPDGPDPSDLALDYEAMVYGSDAPTEYDPS